MRGTAAIIRRLILTLLIAILIAGRAAAADQAYETKIDIAGDATGKDALLALLKDSSQLIALAKKPPATEEGLRRRAEDDIARFKGVLAAEGYYKGALHYEIAPGDGKAKVTIAVTPGPLFHLGSATFRMPDGGAPKLLQQRGPPAIGLTIGGPATSAPVAAAGARIAALYAANGQPFAKLVDQQVVVDLATETMAVTLVVEPGPTARFGATTIAGLQKVKRDFVERRIAWHAGRPYDGRQVLKTQQDIAASGLFSEVRVGHADHADADGTLPMTITVTEGPRHSVGAGAGYNTTYGIGVRAFWEDRSLFGEGEDLRISAGVAQKQLGAAINFRRPDVGWQGQDFLAGIELLRQETDAYDSRRVTLFSGFEERQFLPFVFGFGISIERADLTTDEPGRDENYLLAGLPLYVRRDTTDDPLNPTRGTRARLTIVPYHSLENGLAFVSSRLDASGYQRLGSDRLVLAGFGAIGSIFGPNLGDIPLDKRLYAGGAGSVRGYGYQLAGPVDSFDKPTGGRSSLEVGAELRYRFTDSFGVAPFLEAGNVYPSSYPDSGKLFAGGGLGFRYYTAIGPIRLDVAFPFEKRPVDNPVQFYISLGQAF